MSLRRFTALMFVAAALMMSAGLAACTENAETVPPAQEGSGIVWTGYTEGMAKAAETGKPVMIDFFTTWCKYCKMLDETTYKDKEIVSLLNNNFVAIKVDAEGTDNVMDKGKEVSKAELARNYSVSGFPTVWFIDAKGERVGVLPGYTGPEEMKSVLTYFTSGAQARGVTYPDYVNSPSPSGPDGGTDAPGEQVK